jgi:hypothetical protein
MDPEDKATQFRQGVRPGEIKKSAFVRHQFGFTAGGPLVRNKTFAFGSAEWIRVRSTAPRGFFVPTQPLINAAAPNMQEIFRAFPPPANRGPFLTAGDLARREPSLRDATGNLIPADTPLFGLVNVNAPADAGGGTPQNTVMGVAKLDHHVSEKTQVFARYAFEQLNFLKGTFSLSPYSAFNTGSNARNHNIALQMNHAFNQKLVMEARFVYHRLHARQPLGEAGVAPFFFFDFLNIDPRGPISLPGYLTKNFLTGLPFGGPQNGYQSFGTATWIRGPHSLKFGAQYVHLRDHRTFGAFAEAAAVFRSLQSFVHGFIDGGYSIAVDPRGRVPGDPPRSPPSASFPEGLTLLEGPFGPPSFTRHFRYNEIGLFVEDSIKLHPRFTFTLGLRWEYFGVLHSPEREKALDSNLYLGPGDTLFERIRNARFRRVIDNRGASGFYRRDWGNYSPRAGFAWDPFGDGATALRGGWGVFYDRNFGNAVFRVFQNPPAYAVITQLDPIRASLDQYAALGARFPLVTSARMLDENLRAAHANIWNLTLQHKLRGRSLVTIGYVGSSGLRLYSLNNINRFGSCQFLPATDPAHCRGEPRTRRRLNNSGVTEFNRRSNEGLSRYHALLVSVDSAHIQSAGLWLGGNWTWGHALTNTSSTFGDSPFVGQFGFGFLDPYNPRLDYGSADFDIRHRGTAHWRWEIPMKRGIRGAARQVLQGWQLTGIVTYRTGFPFTIYHTGDPTFSFTSLPRAVLSGRPPPMLGASNPTGVNTFRYVDLTGFSRKTNSDSGPFDPATLGNNTYRAPGMGNWDLGLYKEFAVAEKCRMQARLEMFNAWNHPNLFADARTNDVRTSSMVTARFRGHRNVQVALKFFW